MNKYLPILFFLLYSCSFSEEDDSSQYQLIQEDGVYVEVFDSTNTDQNRYTANNQVFVAGRAFVYDFYHESKHGERLSFRDGNSSEDWGKSWEFVDLEDENSIKQVTISTKSGLSPFIESIPFYNQTVVKYAYATSTGQPGFNSMSGVIENEKNIWLHPPRDKFFRILELNPFPFVQAPFELNNSWEWSLHIGSSWGDERWKTWDETIKNTYHYEFTDKKTYKTAWAELECWEISAEAQSRIGKTYLVSLFNPIYGFVKLSYLNIDSSKTVLELVEVQEP